MLSSEIERILNKAKNLFPPATLLLKKKKLFEIRNDETNIPCNYGEYETMEHVYNCEYLSEQKLKKYVKYLKQKSRETYRSLQNV